VTKTKTWLLSFNLCFQIFNLYCYDEALVDALAAICEAPLPESIVQETGWGCAQVESSHDPQLESA
jgi:hypothetical protein